MHPDAFGWAVCSSVCHGPYPSLGLIPALLCTYTLPAWAPELPTVSKNCRGVRWCRCAPAADLPWLQQTVSLRRTAAASSESSSFPRAVVGEVEGVAAPTDPAPGPPSPPHPLAPSPLHRGVCWPPCHLYFSSHPAPSTLQRLLSPLPLLGVVPVSLRVPAADLGGHSQSAGGRVPFGPASAGLSPLQLQGQRLWQQRLGAGPSGAVLGRLSALGFLFVFWRLLSLEGLEEPRGWENGATTEVWLVSEKPQPVGTAEGHRTWGCVRW